MGIFSMLHLGTGKVRQRFVTRQEKEIDSILTGFQLAHPMIGPALVATNHPRRYKNSPR